jgi:hypothetical protein
MTELYHITRICKTCGIEKVLETDFNKQKSGKFGYRAHCIVCRANERKAAPPRTEWVEVLSKICPKCDPPTGKPISEFAVDKSRRDKCYPYCLECQRRIANSEKSKTRRHTYERERNLADPGIRQSQQAYQIAWRERNIEKLRLQWREKYANDPEYAARMYQHTRKWMKENPEKVIGLQMKRKAAKQGAIVEETDYYEIMQEYGGWCYICEQPILPEHTIEFDHLIPLLPRPGNPQGHHSKDNIRPTHKVCNARKSNKRLEDLTPFDRRGP